MKFQRVICTCILALFSFPLFGIHKHKVTQLPVPSVDIVYTWVDSSDPEWRAEKAKYARAAGQIAKDANATCRFRSRKELLYSLRSIEKYAPYVRKIFIVTAGHKPAWIKEHPKITFISHAQIFRNPSSLPTYNSMAIESCLHRIPDLSEYYVYLNDDVFLGRPTTFSTFFTKNGKVKLFLTEKKISRKEKSSERYGYRTAIKNTDRLLTEAFSPEERKHHAHTPDPARKSLVTSIEIQFPHIFRMAETHRFRCAEDYALTNGLIPYASLYLGNGEKAEVSHKNIVLRGDPSYEKDHFAKVLKMRPQFFCIQDVQTSENKATDRLLERFLESYFPDPAPWEVIE